MKETELSPEQIQIAIRKKWRDDKRAYRLKNKTAMKVKINEST